MSVAFVLLPDGTKVAGALDADGDFIQESIVQVEDGVDALLDPLVAVNDEIQISVRQGDRTCAIEITGTYVGTVIFEFLCRSGNWRTMPMGSSTSTAAASSATSGVGYWSAAIPIGATKIRARCTAYTSGAIVPFLAVSQAELNYRLDMVVPNSTGPAGDGATAVGASVAGFDWNGATWDRQRNNTPSTSLLASAARTTAQTGADQTNFNHSRLVVVLDVTVVPGSGGLTLSVQGKDATSAKYYNLLTDAAPVTAVGTYVFELGSGVVAASEGVRASSGRFIPRIYRVNIAVGSAASYTYSISSAPLL